MSRAAFLERVRLAAQQGLPHRVQVAPIPPGAGYVGSADDLAAALAKEIHAVGGESRVVDNWEAAREQTRAWLRRHNVRSALCWHHPTLERLSVSDLLAGENVAAFQYTELSVLPVDEQRRVMLAADIGISGADYAVAETGTVVVGAAPGRERVTSLVPAIHLAIVQQSQIVPDLFDLFSQLADRGPDAVPSALALISGPSKTGDIELELTTGVHGPGTWYVLIVRDGVA